MWRGLSKGGLLEISDGLGNTTSIPTFTCCHCNTVHEVPAPGSDQMGFCQQCFARECLACAKLNRCAPFEKKLEAIEARDKLMRSMGIG